MYQNQMTFNGLPSSASSSSFQLPFFTPGFLDSHHLSPILPSVPWGNTPDFGGAVDVWKEEMSAGGGGGGGEEELSDDCSQPGEKKRRLSMDQVRTLERNFEFGNKLEPERKLQLAAALGLQPRQIAIWFQNRRARWKTKQLEKDYEMLKREFDVAKSQNDALLAHNSKLQSELFALRGREGDEPINLNKETEGSSSNRSENSSDFNLDTSRKACNNTKPSSLNHGASQSFPFYRASPEPAQGVKNESSGSGGRGGRGGNEDTFCSIFGSGMAEEPAAFWPWTDH